MGVLGVRCLGVSVQGADLVKGWIVLHLLAGWASIYSSIVVVAVSHCGHGKDLRQSAGLFFHRLRF